MARVASPELASLWRKRIDVQQRSGSSILEYCRREGVSAANFHAWKRRLRGARKPVERKPKKRAPQQVATEQSPRGGFVRVPLAVESAFEVRFSDGTVVSVAGEDLAALAVTLKTLKFSQAEGGTDD